jgi:hypothetical protein
MNKLLVVLGQVVRSKWFWIIVGLILLLLILRRNWYMIRGWFQPSDIDGQQGPPDASRLPYLKALANSLYVDIYDTPLSGHTYEIYEEALELPDNELKYVSKYYRQHITSGVWLYEDIDNEGFSLWTNIDTQLMAKLSKVGESSNY